MRVKDRWMRRLISVSYSYHSVVKDLGSLQWWLTPYMFFFHVINADESLYSG